MALLRLPLVLKELYENFRHLEDPVWITDDPTDDDLNHVIKEGSERSEFDPLMLRLEMLKKMQKGSAVLVTKSCRIAKVLAIVTPEQVARIPWAAFGRIFATFGPSEKPWRLVWFASDAARTLPTGAAAPAPTSSLVPTAAHMNGGYAFPCQPETIVIYREEEAPRVVAHELLHAACTDDRTERIEIIEAKTESWAELILVAALATSQKHLAELWAIQSQWIADQEEILKGLGVLGPDDYAWRYTVARRQAMQEIGVAIPPPSTNPFNTVKGSMRFSSPQIAP